ncbi:MAG: multicopper oxidase domain-containing protein [Chloroflexota bacterium]
MTSLTRRAGLMVVLVALLAGCVRYASDTTPRTTPTGNQGGPVATLPPRPTVPPTPVPSPTVAPTATPDDGAQVVEVSLLDSMQIKPAKITVKAGTPVRFVITNDGALEHDFFIGSDREQRQRRSGEEPGPDRYVAVPPGETKTLLYVFPSPGKTIVGCVVPGHYSAGMKANVTIRTSQPRVVEGRAPCGTQPVRSVTGSVPMGGDPPVPWSYRAGHERYSRPPIPTWRSPSSCSSCSWSRWPSSCRD